MNPWKKQVQAAPVIGVWVNVVANGRGLMFLSIRLPRPDQETVR